MGRWPRLFIHINLFSRSYIWPVWPSALFPSDVHVAVCYVVDCQFVACLGACPSARFPSDVHVAVLFCLWLSICCLLSGVSISPFFVRCPRCCFVISLAINLLPFGRCVHQPVFCPMSTLLFVMWLIVNLLSFGRCGHQPVSRPMSTVLLCHIVGYQLVAFCPACPSARFSSDVHGVALFCLWLSICCLP